MSYTRRGTSCARASYEVVTHEHVPGRAHTQRSTAHAHAPTTARTPVQDTPRTTLHHPAPRGIGVVDGAATGHAQAQRVSALFGAAEAVRHSGGPCARACGRRRSAARVPAAERRSQLAVERAPCRWPPRGTLRHCTCSGGRGCELRSTSIDRSRMCRRRARRRQRRQRRRVQCRSRR